MDGFTDCVDGNVAAVVVDDVDDDNAEDDEDEDEAVVPEDPALVLVNVLCV